MRIGAMWAFSSAANYRAISPLEVLGQRGHDIVMPHPEGSLPFGVLSTCDAVIVYRRFDPQTRDTLRRLKDAGVAVVWDNDDDYLHMPMVRKIRRETGGMSNRQLYGEVLKTARLAHVVTATTERLARVLREDGGLRDVRVIENYITVDARPPRRRDPDKLTVGWIAGMEHRADATKLGVAAMLRRAQERHPQLAVTSVGVDLRLRERYGHAAHVPFPRLPEAIADFDIGIAPLSDTTFNRARSNIKVKEYAATGVPWLASPVEPYAALGEAQGGRLVPDDQWDAAIDALVQDAAARDRLSAAGMTWARTQTIGEVIGRYETLLSTLVEAVSGRPAAMPMPTSRLSIEDATAGMRAERIVARVPRGLLRRRAGVR